MPRVKRGTKRRARRKKILERASGYFLTKSKLFRSAKESVERALKFAYSGRRQKKRQYRSLWIVRIGAAARYKLDPPIVPKTWVEVGITGLERPRDTEHPLCVLDTGEDHGQLDVPRRGHARHQVVGLEHEGDLALAHAGQLVLAVSGDVKNAEVVARAQQIFGTMAPGQVPMPPVPAPDDAPRIAPREAEHALAAPDLADVNVRRGGLEQDVHAFANERPASAHDEDGHQDRCDRVRQRPAEVAQQQCRHERRHRSHGQVDALGDDVLGLREGATALTVFCSSKRLWSKWA